MPVSPAPDEFEEERRSGIQAHWVGQTLRSTYRILEVLDQGGMGLLFAAEHVRLKRRVAVKVLADHLAASGQALDRFHREAEIISRLHHPNIVHVLDFDTTESGAPYLVMELLDGESVAQLLERDQRISAADAARIVAQVASGLAAAHRAGVVHRDLKPANIFLVKMPDDSAFVKLLDFGISKASSSPRGLTGEFDILGTPEYMPPEQALGKTALVDHRGDQYSLAVIAFEMLSGETPFVGIDVMDTLRKVVGTEPPALGALIPGIAPEIDAVLTRALAKDPDARFPDVAEFAAAFARAAGHASLTPPTPQVAPTLPVPADPTKVRGDIVAGRRTPAMTDPTIAAETQLRSRMPSYPDSAETNPAREVQSAIEAAREAVATGNTNAAVDLVETALTIAESTHSQTAKQSIERAGTLFNRIFLACLGDLNRRLVVREVPSTQSGTVSPEQAFVLSRLDGSTTVEEVLDLTPMPRQQALRLLVGLLRRGLIDAV